MIDLTLESIDLGKHCFHLHDRYKLTCGDHQTPEDRCSPDTQASLQCRMRYRPEHPSACQKTRIPDTKSIAGTHVLADWTTTRKKSICMVFSQRRIEAHICHRRFAPGCLDRHSRPREEYSVLQRMLENVQHSNIARICAVFKLSPF